MVKNTMKTCPICKNNNSKNVYKNKKMSYGIGLFKKKIDLHIHICKNCNFVFQSSSYNKVYDKNIKKLYSSYTISNMYNFPNKNYANTNALEFVSSYIENKIDFNVLEIGSNRGDFLYLLKEKFPKINILGCEPTEFKDLKIPTINSFFSKNLFNTKFDLIILRHTLEHIKYPKKFLKELEFIQKKDSKIFIEVPNLKYSLENYIEDFTPDHVNFFCKDSLCKLFNKKILKIDDEKYLYAMFENKSFNYKESSKIDFIKQFKKYNKNMQKFIDEILKYDRIIFYGISNFYLWIYEKLENQLKNKEIYFIDDFVEEDIIYNLQKTTKIKENDLIILCSSNKDTQMLMFDKIKQKNIYVFFPWKEIVYV